MKREDINTHWRRALPIYIILFLIIFVALIAPFLESRMVGESFYFYAILKRICHQIPTRCLWIFGSNMALCSRCFGIYLGLLSLGIIYGIKETNKIFWKSAILLVLPGIMDAITQLKGLRESNNFIRFTTGLLMGIGAGMFFFPIYFRLTKSRK